MVAITATKIGQQNLASRRTPTLALNALHAISEYQTTPHA